MSDSHRNEELELEKSARTTATAIDPLFDDADVDVEHEDLDVHSGTCTSPIAATVGSSRVTLDDGGPVEPPPHSLPSSRTRRSQSATVQAQDPAPAPPTRSAAASKRNVARKTVPGYGGKGKGKTHFPGQGAAGPRITKTARAGLVFAVARVRGCLKRGRYAERITDSAAVYLTAVLEYLVAELLELSGHAAHQLNRKRISPRHVSLAARNDEEFVRLVPISVIFPEGGFVPVLGFVQKDAPLLRVESGAPRTGKKSR